MEGTQKSCGFAPSEVSRWNRVGRLITLVGNTKVKCYAASGSEFEERAETESEAYDGRWKRCLARLCGKNNTPRACEDSLRRF